VYKGEYHAQRMILPLLLRECIRGIITPSNTDMVDLGLSYMEKKRRWRNDMGIKKEYKGGIN